MFQSCFLFRFILNTDARLPTVAFNSSTKYLSMYELVNQNKDFQLRLNNRYNLENERILSLKTDICDKISNEPWSMFLRTYMESKLMISILIRTRLQMYFSRTRKVFLLLCSIILSQWLSHWPTWKIDLIKHNSPGLTTHVYANVGNFRLSRASFGHQNHLRWLLNWLMVFYVNQLTFAKPRVSIILDLGPIETIISVDLSLQNDEKDCNRHVCNSYTLVCLKCGVLKIWNFGKFCHFLKLV